MTSSLPRVIDGELIGWHGLERALGADDLARQLPADWAPAPENGLRGGRSFRILRAARVGLAEDVEAWIPVGDTAVSSLEYRPPGDLDHAAILADLGEPELVMKSNRYEPDALVRDHVHAGRGITVAVAEPLPRTERGGGRPVIVYVQLYEATTTTEFVTRIGQSGVEPHPYPL